MLTRYILYSQYSFIHQHTSFNSQRNISYVTHMVLGLFLIVLNIADWPKIKHSLPDEQNLLVNNLINNIVHLPTQNLIPALSISMCITHTTTQPLHTQSNLKEFLFKFLKYFSEIFSKFFFLFLFSVFFFYFISVFF